MGLRRALTNRLHGILALALCLAASGVCSPERLHAQDCCTCTWQGIARLSYEAPFDPAARTVPPNARIRVYLGGGRRPESVTLSSGPDDVAFDLVPVATDIPDTFWLVPREPLTPGRSYDLSVEYVGTHRYLVDNDLDLTAPSISEAVGGRPLEGEYCTELIGVAVAASTSVLEPGLTLEVELLRGVEVIAHRMDDSIRGGLFVSADDPACLGRFHVDGLVEGEDLTARVRVWDLAGNPSEFVTVSVTPSFIRAGPPPSPCGRWCSAGVPSRGDVSLLAGLLVALAALGVRQVR